MPLRTALFWIVMSIVWIPGIVYRGYVRWYTTSSPVCRLIQTSSIKGALPTPYLAELMQLSADRPTRFHRFNCRVAKQRLMQSPVIQQARVRKLPPDTLYVDYEIREPCAMWADVTNIATDREGVCFPLLPFFSPKKLPKIYLGNPSLAKLIQALDILQLLQKESFCVQQIDMTASEHPSLGQREIVVIVEVDRDLHYLRLTPKQLLQEIGNYRTLRPQLPSGDHAIDLRISRLAFIEDHREPL